MMASILRDNRVRLLASTAAATLFWTGTARAEDEPSRPSISMAELVAQDASTRKPTLDIAAADASTPESLAPERFIRLNPVVPVSQIVISQPSTPTTAIDPVAITGVGQMIVDEQNGFIGLCTGTLINPRTVLFAAHCVNERAANAYGENSGGQPIAFGFNVNNNVAGNSAFGNYLNGPDKYKTVTSRYLYDANYVAYNPLSLEPNAAGFLYGDVAVASLDTPASNIPTWALLFSPLTAPTTIGASGTGFHVTIDGYGNNGTGITGSTGGIDYRRRLADNILGGLASLDAFENFLFGGNSTTNPQNLYWIDFDDPRRGTAAASRFDFNAWRDNATGQEGTTASGDSGGPLILDQTYARKLVIGVLSGGYTRFFTGQAPNGYGTVSFYQPLYLYWDWIAANNPYHYVSAKAGDGNWSDPTHWQTNLDPNYFVISGNTVVNGIPTATGAGNTVQPGFGQTCFQSGGVSDCLDIRTGVETVDVRPIGTGGDTNAPTDSSGLASNGRATVSVGTLDGQADGTGDTSASGQTSATVTSQAALPAPTLANGLPGATNFVPNNFDGNRLASQAPRYFDVTLSAAGTTTLDSAVTVDRLTINGLNAALNITSTGSLTSNIDVTQTIGTLTVNGRLTSRGDFFMATGGLSGTGTIAAPFFTSLAGTIAPGTPTTIGTLNFQGNVILASANAYLIDIGANGQSDRIAVTAGSLAGSGQANLGGLIAINASAATLRANNLYTIVTATGGISGSFTAPGMLSAILRPTLLYSANQVQLRVDALPYSSVVSPTTPVEVAYARLLDTNRGQTSALDPVYATLDLQSAATIRGTLDGLVPASETTNRSVANMELETLSRFIGNRLEKLDPSSELGGTVAMIGQPIQLASLSLEGMPIASAAGATGGGEQTVSAGKLPSDMRAYLAGGYINGDSSPSTFALTTARDQFDGWFIAGGIEKTIGSSAAVGFSVAYADVRGQASTPGQTAAVGLLQGSVYGKIDLHKGLTLDGQFSGGILFDRTRRSVNFVGTNYVLTSRDSPLTINADVGLSKTFDLTLLSITPRVGFRAGHITFGQSVETGGPVALIARRLPFNNAQSRAGLTFKADFGSVRPIFTATYVHEFNRHQGFVLANFRGATSAYVPFGLNGTDRDWAELGGGLAITGKRIDVSVEADTTAWRSDVAYQTYRGTLTYHF